MGKYINLQIIYFILILLVFAFITTAESSDLGEPVVWYFNGLPTYYCATLSFVFFLFTMINGNLSFDSNASNLLLRVFFCLIPLSYITDSSSFSAHYPIVIVTFVAYMIGHRKHGYNFKNIKTLQMIVISFVIILTLQVVLTFQTIEYEYFNLSYKSKMFIPIAGSNVIASYIAPALCMFIVSFKTTKRYLKPAILLLLIVGLVLTKSRGGIVTLLLTYLIYRLLLQNRFKGSYAILIILGFFVFLKILLSIPEVELFFMGFTADDNMVDARGLSSGRLTIFQHELERFINHPVFGNGMVFNNETSLHGSHNLVIELLVQSGVVGTLLYIIPIWKVLRSAYKNIKLPSMKGWLIYIIAMLINGMFEVNFFNWSTDIIFWFVCGVIISISNNPEKIIYTSK